MALKMTSFLNVTARVIGIFRCLIGIVKNKGDFTLYRGFPRLAAGTD